MIEEQQNAAESDGELDALVTCYCSKPMRWVQPDGSTVSLEAGAEFQCKRRLLRWLAGTKRGSNDPAKAEQMRAYNESLFVGEV
jgi:hypothetical protein